MAIEIRVPQMGESVTEGVIASWLKKVGETVAADEPVVEVETDKITVEVPAPAAGVLVRQSAAVGDTVAVGDVLGVIDPAAGAGEAAPLSEEPQGEEPKGEASKAAAASAGAPGGHPMPSARAEAARQGVDLSGVQGSGRGGRILKEDVQRAASTQAAAAPPPTKPTPPAAVATPVPAPRPRPSGARSEERKSMTPIRRRVAERLVQSQQGTATLTTFNEVDMSAVIELRKRYKDEFVKRHGIKLGFMSFFVKAACEALREFPPVNAEIDGDDVIYKHYYDIGVAVGGGKGLVVPIIRDADQRGFADIEATIADFGKRAQANKLTLDELQGGTFTVSNGGVYGSMLSTPILNPPQTGILGLHNIVERPVAVDGKVEIRPIMYVALSYDHRLIDGREAVQFLVRIKQLIEHPERLLLDV
ncbi:2-oxoglutarate dehydrogenase complex dihydrolipoyllysine-residue succinyltransferase [Paraliomyxa miuraensis]|uniref:2-oxoglutarate dehydrogenase complex dihydrolipoyllysine-residue succinyltransferase n=1 Tax=Paraliomyxa miuraensis TaxID=376150 RepID=UPI00224EE701|nr:2-oxoglutarate dehydrogenase complex dihydrolipoyllysine-residue succinyltransferase [Paraliomyxa miuraensis]MCX4243798.1 2-oxoglutarate dehydrogenase complex dihydrolipoyllysine-residue succinyltransferase [Paraliomyxa miuraensis]